MAGPLTLSELAGKIGAELVGGDGGRVVVGCASIEAARPDEVAFLANAKYLQYLESSKAAAVIADPRTPRPAGVALLVAKDPYFAFRNAMIELHGFRVHPPPMDAPPTPSGPTISPRAAVHSTATIGEWTVIHPFATVERGAVIGARSVLYPGAYVGPDSRVGDDCILYPGVAVYDRCIVGNRVTLHANTVIGQDGFGYATHAGAHHKIPQHGIVVIEDDVELGAACAIERAAMGETRIGQGTKFADLISIGHGTTIGRHCLLVSLVGVAGSVEVGNYVVLGGQVGVSGHISIGDGVQAAGKTAIIADTPAGMKVGGIPAVEFNKAKRNALVGADLFGLAKKVRELEEKIARLEGGGR
ncbi:MAG: UDP-3-O-(3-hydroxymyristoyl)glucosamine N-acyltransferase [Phycisphaeraceae bacterium]|nr:UDP-3-O-(3-hydroxymyristoyl)glucosamine N-acyltransferase [Phycisphaerales bacterium]QOJ16955.1 MAG: UDP-3-O-(3-hydroxymyristoyl)glucosamine N-acyltransferase [Phycisphaeraceae bacterium]